MKPYGLRDAVLIRMANFLLRRTSKECESSIRRMVIRGWNAGLKGELP